MKPANPHTLTINGGSSSVAFALFQGACFDWAFLPTLPRVAKLLRIPGHCETFVHIVDSMFNQHAKGLKVTSNLRWRRKVASLNYLLTTHVWRQDHNSFTHQDPGVVHHVVSKKLTIKHGQDLPEIRNWKWSLVKASTPAGKRPARRR